MHRSFFSLLFCALLCSCDPNSRNLEPTIQYAPTSHLIEQKDTSFSPLKFEELKQGWGKELLIANRFAREFDLYRAITAYKRAQFLSPQDNRDRRLQMDYGIVLSYYLGGKFLEAIEHFEASALFHTDYTFSAYDDLLIVLYDSYQKSAQPQKAAIVYSRLEIRNPQKAANIKFSEAIISGNLEEIREKSTYFSGKKEIDSFLKTYEEKALSVRTAQILNGVLPGAGYYYVGQKTTALTSFTINALFSGAAWRFFLQGNIAAGVIIASLEIGWYIGGINGAGLAAKEYNERLYEVLAKDILIQKKLFPVLMLQSAY